MCSQNCSWTFKQHISTKCEYLWESRKQTVLISLQKCTIWHTPAIPALTRQRQQIHGFEPSLGYSVSSKLPRLHSKTLPQRRHKPEPTETNVWVAGLRCSVVQCSCISHSRSGCDRRGFKWVDQQKVKTCDILGERGSQALFCAGNESSKYTVDLFSGLSAVREEKYPEDFMNECWVQNKDYISIQVNTMLSGTAVYRLCGKKKKNYL